MYLLRNMVKHFVKICKHKFWVGYYCFKLGIPIQGILHDLSKFHPVEFFESVKYYQGGSSPIDACKKAKGYSNAWMHHKGRNKHHYEYWVDSYDDGGKPLVMPYRYAKELICDYLGAGRAYYGKEFTYLKEYEWWQKKKAKPLAMHPAIKNFIGTVLCNIKMKGKLPDDQAMRVWYKHWVDIYKRENKQGGAIKQ